MHARTAKPGYPADDCLDAQGDFSAGSIDKRILVFLPVIFLTTEDWITVRLFRSQSLRFLASVGVSADSAEANVQQSANAWTLRCCLDLDLGVTGK